MNYLTLLILFFSLSTFSQSSQLYGTVYSSDTTEVVHFIGVKLTSATDSLYTTADINGNYKFNNLKADTFTIYVKNPIYGNKEIRNALLKPNDSLHVNVILSNPLFVCDYFYWRPPPAYPIGDENHIKIKSKDIKNLKTIRIENRVASLSSDFHQNVDKMYVRGTRSNNVICYVDGVKQNNTPNLPRVAVHSMSFYLGGVPAKYGDTTSGVISVSTTGYFNLYYDWKSKQ